MPGNIWRCYSCYPGRDPLAEPRFFRLKSEFVTLLFRSVGFSLSTETLSCQDTYLLCWGCSTYLGPGNTVTVDFLLLRTLKRSSLS